MRRLLAWCVPNRALCWRTLDLEPWQRAVFDAAEANEAVLVAIPRTNGKTVW